MSFQMLFGLSESNFRKQSSRSHDKTQIRCTQKWLEFSQCIILIRDIKMCFFGVGCGRWRGSWKHKALVFYHQLLICKCFHFFRSHNENWLIFVHLFCLRVHHWILLLLLLLTSPRRAPAAVSSVRFCAAMVDSPSAMKKTFSVPEIKPLDQYNQNRAKICANIRWLLSKLYGCAGTVPPSISCVGWGARASSSCYCCCCCCMCISEF